ncbi:MAG: hypothetical protein JNL43_01150 [Flavobacteriales bacterium]|nr:hypothetical protein [Flavobacteriales bacterium]
MSSNQGVPSVPLLLALLVPAVLKLFLLNADISFEPHTIALEWIGSGEFRYHHLGAWNYTYQFPVYPAIVAGLYLLGLGKSAVLVFQVVCGTASAYLIHRIALIVLAGRPYAGKVGFGVALLTGLSPFLAYYQVRVLHPFAWDMLLAMGLVYLSLTTRTARPGPLMALFALAGLALLDRPTLVVFLLPFLWNERSFLWRAERLPLKVLLLLVLLLPTGAWLVRNHAVTGRFELNSATAQNLWIGIQEATEGSAQLPNGQNYLHLLTPTEGSQLVGLDAAGQSSFFREKWRAELDGHPGLWWTMMGVKLKNFWLYRSHLGIPRTIAELRWAVPAFKTYTVVLFVLLIAAWWLRCRQLNIVLLSTIALSVVQSLFYVETRHRLLVEPLLMMMALAVIAETWEHRRRRSEPAVMRATSTSKDFGM